MKKYIHHIILVGFLTCGLLSTYAQTDAPESVEPQSVSDVPVFTISPNPVHGNTFFYLEIDSCRDKSLNTLIIYNSDGFIIQNKPIQLQEGDNRFLVNVAGFHSGYYIVRVVGKNIPNSSVSRQIMID
jgi:hypothetical protein